MVYTGPLELSEPLVTGDRIEYPGAPRPPADTSWITMTTIDSDLSWRSWSLIAQGCAIVAGASAPLSDWSYDAAGWGLTLAAATAFFGILAGIFTGLMAAAKATQS